MNEKQTQRTLELLKSFEGGAVQPAELARVIKVLLDLMKEMRSSLDNKISETKSETTSSIKEMSYELNGLELKFKELINGSEGASLSQIKELSKRLNNEINRIESSIPSMPDLSVYENKLVEIENKIPVIKDAIVDNPVDIRNKLESLKDDDRLNVSAISGLDKTHTALTDDIINRAIGIVDQRTSFLINKVSNLQTQVNNGSATGGGHVIQDEGTPLAQRAKLNFVGAGVSVTDDAGNDATKVTISTSAGAGFQQPTGGAINGTNLDFTWATAPNAICIDSGRIIQKVSSDGTVNWTGTTTTSLSIAPNFDIYAVA